MKDNTYQRFASLLQTGSFGSYEEICRHLCVCPDDLDEVLLSELGVPGNEVFCNYFGNHCNFY